MLYGRAVNSLPAHCPVCGLTFYADGFYFENVTGVTLVGARQTCPRCGSMADVADGTFNFRDGVVEVLAAPGWTIETLDRLAAAAEQAEAVLGDDPEAAVSLIESVSKRAGRLLRQAQDLEESREMAGLKTLLKYLRQGAIGAAALYGGGKVVVNLDDIARAVLDAIG